MEQKLQNLAELGNLNSITSGSTSRRGHRRRWSVNLGWRRWLPL